MADVRPTLPELEDISRELVDAHRRLQKYVDSTDPVGRHLAKAFGRINDINADIEAARKGLTNEQPLEVEAEAGEAEADTEEKPAKKSAGKKADK